MDNRPGNSFASPALDDLTDEQKEFVMRMLKESAAEQQLAAATKTSWEQLFLQHIPVVFLLFIFAFFTYKLVSSLREKERKKEEKKKLKQQRKEKDAPKKKK